MIQLESLLLTRKGTSIYKSNVIKSFSILIFLLLFITPTILFAEDTRGLCIPRSVRLEDLQKHLKIVLKQSDKVTFDKKNNCLEIKLSNVRFDLFKKYIGRRFPLGKTYTKRKNSSTTILNESNDRLKEVRRNCDLTLVENESLRSKKRTAELNTGLSAKEVKRKVKKYSQTNMMLGANLSGHLTLNENGVQFKCRPVGRSKFQITLMKESLRGSSISTSVMVNAGEKLDVGSVYKDLNQKDRKISLDKGIKLEKIKGDQNIEYYLIVN
jgi:hypothetical protein